MKLFAKGKENAGSAPQAPRFQPIDRSGLLGLLDQVVNSSQSGVLEIREPRGAWTYAFQAGALTHASGGRVRGARQAFDLLWEFQSGEFQFRPGSSALAGNLYIDKSRLLDLLRRSQAALQGPASPYIAPDQQRPVQPVQRPYSPPAPGQIPTWQPPAQSGQPQQWQGPAQPPWQGPAQPAQQPPWQGPGQPGQQPPWQGPAQPAQQPPWQGPGQPAQPTWGNGAYPPAPQGYPMPYPQPQQGVPPAGPPQVYPQPYPAQQTAQPPVQPRPSLAPVPVPARVAPPAPASPRPVTPPSFSVPPMAIPKKRQAAPVYQPPIAPASAIPPVPEVMKPAAPTPPKDDLQSLRASLVAQAPTPAATPTAPAWGVRTAEGTVTAAPVAGKGAGKKQKAQKAPTGPKAKSKFRAALDVRLIKFLLWACERKYSPDDHWTLKDAFEVSTMELREQFVGAFSQSLKSGPKKTINDDDVDQMAAGRMRGRGRKR